MLRILLTKIMLNQVASSTKLTLTGRQLHLQT